MVALLLTPNKYIEKESSVSKKKKEWLCLFERTILNGHFIICLCWIWFDEMVKNGKDAQFVTRQRFNISILTVRDKFAKRLDWYYFHFWFHFIRSIISYRQFDIYISHLQLIFQFKNKFKLKMKNCYLKLDHHFVLISSEKSVQVNFFIS